MLAAAGSRSVADITARFLQPHGDHSRGLGGTVVYLSLPVYVTFSVGVSNATSVYALAALLANISSSCGGHGSGTLDPFVVAAAAAAGVVPSSVSVGGGTSNAASRSGCDSGAGETFAAPEQSGGSTLAGPAVIGASVGAGLILLCLVLIFVVLCLRHRRQHKDAAAPASTDSSTAGVFKSNPMGQPQRRRPMDHARAADLNSAAGVHSLRRVKREFTSTRPAGPSDEFVSSDGAVSAAEAALVAAVAPTPRGGGPRAAGAQYLPSSPAPVPRRAGQLAPHRQGQRQLSQSVAVHIAVSPGNTSDSALARVGSARSPHLARLAIPSIAGAPDAAAARAASERTAMSVYASSAIPTAGSSRRVVSGGIFTAATPRGGISRAPRRVSSPGVPNGPVLATSPVSNPASQRGAAGSSTSGLGDTRRSTAGGRPGGTGAAVTVGPDGTVSLQSNPLLRRGPSSAPQPAS